MKESGLRPLEAGSKAAELIGALYAPLVQQLDPARLAECARGLAVGKAYAERVLRRYRPALWAESGPQLLDRLVQDYPTHGFVLDREELAEVGLPTRAPDDTEAALLNQLALALIAFGTDDDLIALVSGDDGTPTPAAAGSNQGRGHSAAENTQGARRSSCIEGTTPMRTAGRHRRARGGSAVCGDCGRVRCAGFVGPAPHRGARGR